MKYDLEERTFAFAKNIRSFVKDVPKTIANFEDKKQLVRAAGSVGAIILKQMSLLAEKTS